MIFFTDITTNSSNYCLLNINKYNDKRKKKKKKILVDPGVYELKRNPEYSNIELLHHLAEGNLQENEYLSIDYPNDMNPFLSDEFIRTTNENNWLYQNNMQYITTIQFQFQDRNNFIKNFNLNKPNFYNMGKVLGIGNLCRIMYPNSFTDTVFRTIINNREGIHQVHFYGLALRLIKKYGPILQKFGIQFSIDSTKWTRACSTALKRQYGLNCKKATRDIFFQAYIKELRDAGLEVLA